MISSTAFKRIINRTHNKIIGAARNFVPEGADPTAEDVPAPFYFYKPWSGIVK